MTDEPKQTTPRPILNSIEAQLFVANIQSPAISIRTSSASRSTFVYGDPPFYGQVFATMRDLT